MLDDIVREFLTESWENLGRLDAEIVELERHPSEPELLSSIFRTIHTIKGTCGFLGLPKLEAVAHSAENVLGQMRDGRLQVTTDAISLILEAVDSIKQQLRSIEATGGESDVDDARLLHKLNLLASVVGEYERRRQRQVEPVEASGEELVTRPAASAAREPADVPIVPKPPAGGEGPADAGPAMSDAGSRTAELSIRIDVDVLDNLMNLVGELVLTRNQLLQLARGDEESPYADSVAHLNRVTTALQEGVMKTRMQPIGNVWNKLPRLVRDLSQVTHKQFELELLGADTELDRTVLEAIKDPLTHMVRNCADHGIESPQERDAVGKPEAGRIRLTAYHEGGHVILRVEDDGRGIDLDKVRAKAVRQGLMSEADAAGLSEQELLQLIFQPGFSTAEQVSSVSGRGVGMDVVKTQIEKIGGTVELFTRRGLGTTIKIKIPLTLAIISALAVEAGGETFAIPQLGIVELVRLAPEDRGRIERIHTHEFFRLRDRLLPLIQLHEVVDLPSPPREGRETNIVVVQVGEEQFGLVVSEVFDTEEIVVKPVGSLLKHIDIYQGTTILGDGRVIMILDVAGIANQAGGMSAAAARLKEADELHQAPATNVLLFNAGGGRSMVVPLSLVARLEEIPSEKIEQAGDRRVVQYRGSLLPLLPIRGITPPLVPPAIQPVIVFSEGRNSMGLLVEQIQDILEERFIVETLTEQPGILGTAILAGRAVDVIDTHYYVNLANPNWYADLDRQPSARVLVVDDSVFFRQLIETALESQGYAVTSAANGPEALRRLDRGESFRVIVSDIEMPEMDGFQFARACRARPDFGETKLVALTSLRDASHETRSREAGFHSHLLKFDPRELSKTLRQLCGARQWTPGSPA